MLNMFNNRRKQIVSAMDYDDLLNRTWDDIPEDKLLPGGQWLVAGRNASLVKPKEDGQSLKVLFNLKAKEPVQVAQEELDELGDYDVTANDLTHTIYVEKPSDWNKVFKFLDTFGVPVDRSDPILNADGKLNFSKAFGGAEAIAEIGQRIFTTKDGETGQANTLSKFQKVEE